MGIKPTQHGIKVLFEQNHTFRVPKYQRGYAWEDDAVTDFLSDIERCLRAREAEKKVSHFFGGVVAARTELPDSGRSEFEVIDGQQRLASFVLLMACIYHKLESVVQELDEKGAAVTPDEDVAKSFLAETLTQIRGLYLTYRDNQGMAYIDIPKLKLSEADGDFFQALIDDEAPAGDRASHERLATAWKLMNGFIDNTIFDVDHVAGAKRVRLLVNQVLEFDCSVIFMAADTRREAYQIFQVLNDRGVQLTDGDLLRARTMELLDTPQLIDIQAKVARGWDEVLRYHSAQVDNFLPWYYASHEGRRPSPSSVADDFMASRFKVQDGEELTQAKAKELLRQVKNMGESFACLDTMGDGEWPLQSNAKVTKWDRERLRLLVTTLRHTNAMPLLLSLTLLTPVRFAEAVATIERFVFRYKTIGNAHIGRATDLYQKHAKAIREAPAKFKIKSLRDELAELLEEQVPEAIFRTKLKEMQYSGKGGNGTIRYLLLTLEDYRSWVNDGGAGVPKCKDKTTLVDFANTSIEHIYPRSAKPADKFAALEAVKDTLGNLTIFGPTDNDKAANKSFADKKPALKKSNIATNRELGALATWDAAAVKKRTGDLVDLAVRVFVP